MTGGPWTRSMKVVHGPGPRRGSMDPWSMLCPHPFQRGSTATGYGEISLTGVFINGVRLATSQVKCMFNQVYSLTEIWSDVGMLNLLTGWLVE